jgi:DNA-binding YbaB/EbfC family protein
MVVFKGIGNLMSLMKQAQGLGGRLESVSNELKAKRATGSAGGGLVEFEVNGLGEVLECRIDPSLVAKGDREMLEDLVAAAANDAAVKARALHAEAVQGIAGGMALPGLDDALAKLSGMAPQAQDDEEEDDEDVEDDEMEDEDDEDDDDADDGKRRPGR